MKWNLPVAFVVVVVLAVDRWFGNRAWLDAGDRADRRDTAVTAAREALRASPDGAEALKAARAGLDEFPDEPALLLVQGAALVRRGRYTDAELPLDRVLQLATDPEIREEAEFYAAAARCSRYIETKERADLNLSQAFLERAASSATHGAYANALLGRAFAVAGAQRDPAKALERIDAALAAPPGSDVVDRAKLTALAEQLRTELGP
ncbi:MAG: hypothetical protein IPH13_07065 [Planctomycetes bacterium]|nr:hypothetical protein [Planctomycetota bacterium]